MKLVHIALSLLWATKASAHDAQKEDIREVAAALHLDSQLVRESYLRGIDQDVMITQNNNKNRNKNTRQAGEVSRMWVDAHNTYRQDYADTLDGSERRTKKGEVKTYKYVAIEWDTSLRDMAQVWADEIVKDCKNRAPKDNYGVNSAQRTRRRDQQNIKNIMDQWNRDLDTFPNRKSRAMTQALWMGSKYVGCADAVSDPDVEPDQKKQCTFSVCYYAKAGNCGPGKYDSWEDFLISSEAACGPCPPDKDC